jgi:hypothetical protein
MMISEPEAAASYTARYMRDIEDEHSLEVRPKPAYSNPD